jgi:CubicO group peptidase (beta-lactamase class C family)
MIKGIRCMAMAVYCAILLMPMLSAAPHSELVQVVPETVGMDGAMLKHIDGTVHAAIKAGETPGAVVLVARHGRIAYWKAFGNRALVPVQEPMTIDTIFDVASLTKVMATAPSIMRLVEHGVLRLGDKVKRYLPEFTGDGKDDITLNQLLTHYSGLRPDFDLAKEWFGYQAALQELWKEKTVAEPGKEFAYSDLNFITLGEIVRVVSGKTLEEFAQGEIFTPLGMTETRFCPPREWVPRIAPTETRRNTLKYLKGQTANPEMDQMLRGEVHDPTTWRMGGVAGHAGIFSSARDVAIYAQVLLKNGAYPGGRWLSAASVRAMTNPQSPNGAAQVRGLGWDLKSVYSSPRGDLFEGGFGHTGFSGTSLWVCPSADAFIVILSNRVHPNGGKDLNHLRGAIANIVASAITDSR